MYEIRDKTGKIVQRENINEIKIIFTDLDGTLLNSEHKVSDLNLQSLIKARDKGIKIVISTGRTLLSVERIIGKDLKKNNLNLLPGIYLNGSVTFDSSGSLIVDKVIDNNLKMEINDFVRNLNISEYCVWYSSNKTYCFSMNDKIQYHSEIECITPEIIKEQDLKNINVYKVLFCLDKTNLESVLKLSKDKFIKKINVTNTFECFIELFHQDINKLEGIKEICNLYNISLNNALAIGDGENDMEMLNGLPHSVAVSNASDKVKKCAKYIGPSNNENAVAHVLQTFCDI
ncbi:haloacid dehalogenase-like hydrolase, putative [Plasmodium gallinaceum]|uniref:Haloacid dehalogenase-like hydrolase, putative n=1 Tax=Plasmodium gallinaceum TaxID=5849 RepID=A0A1J1H1Z5_PLAGA|nr:haloacid dehalogenase-like hydrolase, putative [Plasmodium gallinaceum]CRG97350.1 haloacid dehalogenase-like hydrolase, putative [Plasmodium gallinaceum]